MVSMDFFRERSWKTIPYIATLYYIEIIYFMFVANFLAGKVLAVAGGFLFAVFLTYHVVALFNRRNLNRIIQLFLMDLHFAYSVAFIMSRFINDYKLSGGDITVSVYRGIVAVIELPMIIALTDELIISKYR